MTSPDTIIAGGAALISSIAALVAIWNAKSASKQADLAEEQADAAKIQAEEAKRSADAAWVQLDHSKHQYKASMIDRQRVAFESLLKGAREYMRFVTGCLKAGKCEDIETLYRVLVLQDVSVVQRHQATPSSVRRASP